MKILKDYPFIAVIIQNDGNPYYYALYDANIKQGDKVMVTGAAAGKIWTVSGVYNRDSGVAKYIDITAEIIGKIDADAYLERVEKREKIKDLKQKMNAAYGRALKTVTPEYIASISEEYRKLKEELESYGERIEAGDGKP